VNRTWIAALVLSAAVATSTAAQQLPPGKWWRRPEVVRVLALSPDQQTRLDAIFNAVSADLIDARGDVEKLNVALRAELDQPQLSRPNIQRITRSLNEARARLFEREMLMLVDMRGVLTEPQWRRLRQQLERRRNLQRPGQRRQ
jgi:Skp family chaperone for outer membrane proteins